jgi:hypothetical protein
MFVFGIGFGQIADYARFKGMSTKRVRKLCQCGGQAISAASIVGVGYVHGPHANVRTAFLLKCALTLVDQDVEAALDLSYASRIQVR